MCWSCNAQNNDFEAASQSGSRMPGLFQAKTGPSRLAWLGRIEKLRICVGKTDAGTRLVLALPPDRLQRQLSSRCGASSGITPVRVPFRDGLSHKAPRRSLVSDARWSSTETGTRKTGISTIGNGLTSSFGRSKAKSKIPSSPRRRDRQAQIGSTRRPDRHSRAAHANTQWRRPAREHQQERHRDRPARRTSPDSLPVRKGSGKSRLTRDRAEPR